MRKLITLTTLLVVGLASAALAATTLTGTLTPNTPNKGAELKLGPTSLPPESAAPSSLTIDLQSGFKTATATKSATINGTLYRPGWADSTTQLCTTSELSSEDCASDAPKSLVGQGSASIAATGLLTQTIPVAISMYLGDPPAGGCPASVEIVIQPTSTDSLLAGQQDAANGTLCRHDGGLQVSFTNLPYSTVTLPPGESVELQNLTLSVGASNRVSVTTTKVVKKKVTKNGKTVTEKVKKKTTKITRVYLLTTPSSCPASGAWSQSTFTVGFGSGTPITSGLSFACKS